MANIFKIKHFFVCVIMFTCLTVLCGCATTDRQARTKAQLEAMQKRFEWWPTDAKPGPIKDEQRGGYWWWPTTPGQIRPWGNRGYVYVYKIIYDYKADELPPAQPRELRPSLLIRKIIKNVKVYFEFDKANLRKEDLPVLADAVRLLKKHPETSILITGNCDIRGSEQYNEKLGRRRAEAVKNYMLENGISPERIKIVSRGKLDAVAPVTDLKGMAKDRNAQFMVAEVEEIMIPAPETGQAVAEVVPPEAQKIEEGKYLIEQKEILEGEPKVETKEYVIKKGDTLSSIAQQQMGGAHRWKYLYELNKDRIKNPHKLKVGQKIIIPIE
ncbi:MAG: OmpA family protein [Candidatus Omnitrophica bacterium]|nr:OmpA family protein [Candidatus Omnitrophota bacterium]